MFGIGKRRTLLINRPFQLRFTLYVCTWVVGLSIAYPFIIHAIFNFFFSYMGQDPMGPAVETLKGIRNDMTRLLILMQIVFVAVIVILSVFVSHRIAGPLYKLSRFLKRAPTGDLSEKLTFRKADYFQELAGTYNELADALRKQRAQVAEAADHLEKGEKDQALAILKALPR